MSPDLATYPGYRFPAEIISHAVWLHHVFSLSLRDVELILAERGVLVTHESIRPGAPGTSTKCSSASGVCSTTCAHRRLERVMDAVQSAVVIPAAEIVIDRCEVEGLSAGLLTGSPCPGCTSPHSPLPERPPVAVMKLGRAHTPAVIQAGGTLSRILDRR